jgi:hypothetical protein
VLQTGTAAFWKPHPIDELARLQGIKPLEETCVLAGGFPECENIDDFLRDIYDHRESA